MPRLTAILTIAIALGIAAATSAAETEGRVAEARSLALSGDRSAALRILDERLMVAPNDAEARALYGTILSWQGDYSGARTALEAALRMKPSMSDAVVALARVELQSGHPARAERLSDEALQSWPDNVDLMIVHAEALRMLNRNPEALAQAEKAVAVDPARDEPRRIRRVLRQQLQSSEAGVTFNYDREAGGGDPLRETELSIRRNTTFGAAVVRLAHAQRLGLDDDLFELEAYPRYRSTSVYLAADYAPQATLYPHSRYAAELFQRVPGGFEASLGFRRLNFETSTDLYTGSASFYHRSWYLGGRIYRRSGETSSSALQVAARRYFAGDSQYIGLRIGKGASRDEFRRAEDLESLTSNEIALEAMLLVRDRWVLNLRGGAGRESVSGRRITHSTMSTGVGFRF